MKQRYSIIHPKTGRFIEFDESFFVVDYGNVVEVKIVTILDEGVVMFYGGKRRFVATSTFVNDYAKRIIDWDKLWKDVPSSCKS